jgi:segregation and condensation protein B
VDSSLNAASTDAAPVDAGTDEKVARQVTATIGGQTELFQAEGQATEAQLAQASPTGERNAGLAALLESLLFAAEEPLAIGRLAGVLQVTGEAVEAALGELRAAQLALPACGLRVQRRGDRLQLVTQPEAAPYIERLLGLDLTTRLSTAALETLAVIAYRQPLTRGEIEAVRGVNCDGVLRTLLSRGLVEPVGRLEQAGRPFQYGTTFQFLQYFGLDSMEALPPLPDGKALGG